MLITQLKGVTSWFFSCITNSTPLCSFQSSDGLSFLTTNPSSRLLNSPVPFQTLGQVWADPYYNNEVFSSSIMSTPFLLRWNIGWLGLFPPDSHLATPLHLTVMSHPGELLLLLYWAGKGFYLTTCISARRCGSDRFLEGGEKGWIGGKYKFKKTVRGFHLFKYFCEGGALYNI